MADAHAFTALLSLMDIGRPDLLGDDILVVSEEDGLAELGERAVVCRHVPGSDQQDNQAVQAGHHHHTLTR